MDPQEWNSKTRALVTRHEGRRRRRYFDQLGNPSIGIGFNLTRDDAIKKLTDLGADWRAILDGDEELTDPQVDKLFDWCFAEALQYAKNLFSNWGDLLPEVQMVFCDMSFQLSGRLAGFTRMREAVRVGDYARVIVEMRLSKWAQQVPARCAEDCAIIEAAIEPPQSPRGTA